VQVREVEVESILTRTGGYLRGITSHSAQPWRGCSFGRSLCGVGCYVRHNRWVTRGEAWGDFLEARANAGEVWRRSVGRERRWARGRDGRFAVFLSSSTEPFLPQEGRYAVTRRLLEAMCDDPPDGLVVQTHGDAVLGFRELLGELGRRCEVRVHVSIESDRETLPGLPPPACSVERRLAAAAGLRAAGLRSVITIAPLLPLRDPETFLRRAGEAADAVVIDHFVGGDGSPDGRRTLATGLPEAMRKVDPASLDLAYRDAVVALARRLLPGRVGVGRDGFAGRLG
jgi:DNA repair photolyase